MVKVAIEGDLGVLGVEQGLALLVLGAQEAGPPRGASSPSQSCSATTQPPVHNFFVWGWVDLRFHRGVLDFCPQGVLAYQGLRRPTLAVRAGG